MQSLKHETQTINADAARIASLRMELIEEMNGLGPIRNGAGIVGFPSSFAADKWLTRTADGPASYRLNGHPGTYVFDPALEPHCLNCKTTENLRDGDECFACYDMRLHDAEMLARHGGDV